MENIYIDNNKFQVISDQYNHFNGISIEQRIALSFILNDNKKLIPQKFNDDIKHCLNSIDRSIIEYVVHNRNKTKYTKSFKIHMILRQQIDLNSIVDLNRATSFSGWCVRVYIKMVSMCKSQGKLHSIRLHDIDTSTRKKSTPSIAKSLELFCKKNNIKSSYDWGILSICPKTVKDGDVVIETETIKPNKIVKDNNNKAETVKSNEIVKENNNKVETVESKDQYLPSVKTDDGDYDDDPSIHGATVEKSVFDLGDARFDRSKLIDIVDEFGGRDQFITHCCNFYNLTFTKWCEVNNQNREIFYVEWTPKFMRKIHTYVEDEAIKDGFGCNVTNLTRMFIDKGYLPNKYDDRLDQVRNQVFDYQQKMFKDFTELYNKTYSDGFIKKYGKPIADFVWKSVVCNTCKHSTYLDLMMLKF